jgi:two-component system, chemotaxis family, protein-glutamate methylesterase/glutaminase
LNTVPLSTDPIFPAPGCDIVVIGGSAGGIPALITLLAALPADFPFPILVVQHLSAKVPSRLPEVLGQRTDLTVKWAEDGERMRPGTVHVAPRDQHLLAKPDRLLALSSADRVGWWRPAVDTLFDSAAGAYGERVVAIVLSGAMWDGARGIASVAKRGGITIVQDEATSGHFDMPAAALDLGRADMTMSPQKIAATLRLLAEAPFGFSPGLPLDASRRVSRL